MDSIFLSSTCIDLQDLRAGIKPVLRANGYRVIASDDPDFSIDSRRHNHDNCLLNIERADAYLLIINNRYGSIFEGAMQPATERGRAALKDYPGISVTWREYLHAVETEKQIRIAIRHDTWIKAGLVIESRRHKASEPAASIDAGLAPELVAFIEYVISQEKQNWITYFDSVADLIEKLPKLLPVKPGLNEFSAETAELLKLYSYAPELNHSLSESEPWFIARRRDGITSTAVIVYCLWKADGRHASAQDVQPFLNDFSKSAYQHGLIVVNTGYQTCLSPPSGFTFATLEHLLNGVVDLGEYTRRVRSDYEHYNRNHQSQYLPLRTDLQKHFIPLTCSGDFSGELFAAIESFLEDPFSNHLTILGDFGTGKSSAMVELTYKMIVSSSPRIPIYVSLRDFGEFASIEDLLTRAMNRCRVHGFNYRGFQALANASRVLLIFDGFDEIATRWGPLQSAEHLRRLNEAVGPCSKVVLTCRRHYFVSESRLTEEMERSLRREVAGRRNYAMIFLRPLTTDQIREFVGKYRPSEADSLMSQIERLPGLSDLATRPVLLDMIIKTLPQWHGQSAAINLSALYGVFTSLWVRDVAKGGAVVTGEQKLAFAEALAGRLHESGRSRVLYSELARSVRDFFENDASSPFSRELFEQEIRTCDFLVRDNEDYYQFVHRSFMEFFVARKIAAALKTGDVDGVFARLDLAPEILSFIAQAVSEDPVGLTHLCSCAFDRAGPLAWNAISALALLKDACPRQTAIQITDLCRQHGFRSGVAWVLGELGEDRPEIVALLERALNDPSRASAWWESAFALGKLNRINDPIAALIEHLPEKWTFEVALEQLQAVYSAGGSVAEQAARAAAQPRTGHIVDSTDADPGDAPINVDPRCVTSIVREFRKDSKGADRARESVRAILDRAHLATDCVDRRSYYAVWLAGELRLASHLANVSSAATHPLASVRNMVAEAIGKIGATGEECTLTPETLRVLGDLLGDVYHRTRLHAAQSISSTGARSLLNNLLEASRREWLSGVRAEIDAAIESLSSSDPGKEENGTDRRDAQRA
jgi:Domain of unknown function (DUF4062)/NACHT domain